MFKFEPVLSRIRVMFELPRSRKQVVLMLADGFILLCAVLAAYYLRLGSRFQPDIWQIVMIAFYPAVGVLTLLAFNVYRQIIRYTGEEMVNMLFKALGLATILWSMFAYAVQYYLMVGLGTPRTVPFLVCAFSLVGIYTLRSFFRNLYWGNGFAKDRRNTLIYGAGEHGFRVAQALSGTKDVRVVGVVDHDAMCVDRDFFGLRVYPPSAIPVLVEQYNVKDCVITSEKPSSQEVKDAIYTLESHHVHTRILPPFSDIATGKNLVSLIREVDVGDLLGRQAVNPYPSLLSKCIADKVVLVTGAGGSIGSELCVQIAGLQPRKLILLEHSEPSLYQIHRRLLPLYEGQLLPVLGSVTDRSLIGELFLQHGIQTVYHAAAYKHVPLVEDNIAQGVYNNIDGTLTVASVAYQYSVERFVLISTDKAVRPTNVMGSTKRWAEIAIQNLARQSMREGRGSVFSAVRFGNVLGSSGSVIPLFKEQIQKGGPVTVTHPEINRFFMSIFEAAQLVIQAGSLAKGGDVFVLDMGESVKIVDLAKNMIRLAGLEPMDPETGQGDIAIEYTGLRPGEKLYEELLIDLDGVGQTDHPKIMTATEPFPSQVEYDKLRADLGQLLKEGNLGLARQLLIELANRREFQ